MSFDPYSVFDVPRGADFQTLRATYRRLARQNHPDVASDKIAATARMAQINRAWAILGDTARRAAWDAEVRLQNLENARQSGAPSEEERRETLRRQAAQREIARAQAHRQASAASQKMKPGAAHSTKNEAKERAASGKPRGSTRQRAQDLKARKTRNRDARAVANRDGPRPAAASASRGPAASPPIASAPDAPRAFALMRQVALAWRLWQRESNAEGAIEMCRAVLVADARNVPARELLGEIFASQNRIGVALMMLDQAIEIAPDDRLLRRKRDQLRLGLVGENASARPPRAPSLWQRLSARWLKR